MRPRKPLVVLSPLVVTGSYRYEVGNFLISCCTHQVANPHLIQDVFVLPVQHTPAPVARCRAVKRAREVGADLLLMIDDDMAVPHAFFSTAVEFLKQQPTPSAIGVPYCTAPQPDGEQVLVFEWQSRESHSEDRPWKLERIPREDAARRSGIQRVANLGTGCVLYDLQCFDGLPEPLFDYQYADASHTEVIETEDCYCHRQFHDAGIPLFVSWDHWAQHAKVKLVGKPQVVTAAEISAVYMSHARAEVRGEERKRLRELEGKLSEMATARKSEAKLRQRVGELKQPHREMGFSPSAVITMPASAPGPVDRDGDIIDPAGMTLPAGSEEWLTRNGDRLEAFLPAPLASPDGPELAAFARDADRDMVEGDTIPAAAPTEPRDYAARACQVLARPSAMTPRRHPFTPLQAARWAQSVPGWMTRAELLWLAQRAAELKPGQHWVEVGVWKGRSLSAAYLAAPEGAVLHAVDTWEGSPAERETAHREATYGDGRVKAEFEVTACALATLRGFSGTESPAVELRVHSMPSTRAAGHVLPDTPDVVFLDGAHDTDSVAADLTAWVPLLRPGALLCGHDRGEDGVRDALGRLATFLRAEPQPGPGSLWYVRIPKPITTDAGPASAPACAP